MFGVASAGPFPSPRRASRQGGSRFSFLNSNGSANAEAGSSTSPDSTSTSGLNNASSSSPSQPSPIRRGSTSILSSSTQRSAPTTTPIGIPLRRASSALPDYVSITSSARPETPSYDEALASGRRMSLLGQNVEPHDYFGSSSLARHESVLEEDEDDPLQPRQIRQPPQLNLIPLPPRPLPIPEPETTTSLPLDIDLPLDLPPPPVSALPPYSPHLANNELRLISTLHQEQSHPSAQFFSQMSSQLFSGAQQEDLGDGREEITGGKKLKINIKRGALRMNGNGMGPLLIRMGREGWIEGTVEVGKVDGAVGLEVSVGRLLTWRLIS